MKNFRVERSINIAAPAEKIFPLIEDFYAWTSWSPYEDRDPNLQRSYGTITRGQGATYAWQGNKNVGSGSMEILQAAPSRIMIDLKFLKPFKAHNQAEFTLQPNGNTTRVTWGMTGPASLMMRVMGLFMNMDKMIGKDFETGLANLKVMAEK
ncbi:MAG: SRPBCC family protein [Rhodospirillales bacterium]